MGKKIYTQEMKNFLFKNNQGRSLKELTILFNEHFGTSFSCSQIRNFRRNHKLDSGLTGRFKKGSVPYNKGKKLPNMAPNDGQFKKGNKPPNYLPVGTINTTTDGYLKKKIADPNVWKLLHVELWEEYNGPVPDGHVIIFLDGDKSNVTLSNLACVTKSDMAQLNLNRLLQSGAEVAKVGIGMVQLKRKVKEITNGKFI